MLKTSVPLVLAGGQVVSFKVGALELDLCHRLSEDRLIERYAKILTNDGRHPEKKPVLSLFHVPFETALDCMMACDHPDKVKAIVSSYQSERSAGPVASPSVAVRPATMRMG